MPGQPKWNAFLAEVEKRGGEDPILERVEAGETLKEIGLDYGVSRSTMYRWTAVTDERKARYQDARKIAAGALVEEAIEILDEASIDSKAGVQKAKAQADIRRWVAGRYDKETFGDDPKGPTVQVNIGALHLDALRQHASPASLPVQEGEFEALPAGEPEE
jgi:hypothetical protein